MCWNCDRPGSTFDDYVEQWLLPTIDRFGWAVTAVDGDRLHAPFAYTIGLTELGLAELVITGLHRERAHDVLETLARHSRRRPRASVRGRPPRPAGEVLGPRNRR